MNATIWPSEIRLAADKRSLTILFEDGSTAILSAELLRVLSPSAEVQGHSPSQRKLVSGKREVAILRIEPVGNYAIRLHFDDLHDTGIYSWPLLHRFGQEGARLMAEYEAELAEKGLSRERLSLKMPH